MSWLVSLASSLLMKLIPWLVAKGIEFFENRNKSKKIKSDIDKRLERVKKAYEKAFNGEPITPEQREDLKRAIADFIRGDTDGGL